MGDPTATLKDAGYVVVGFAVLALQRAQVRRREMEKAMKVQPSAVRDEVLRLATELEERLDPALDELEVRLPPPAQDLFRQARSAAREVRARLAS